MVVPITFEHDRKLYFGHFSSCNGSGSIEYDHWHLMVGKFYYGQLNYSMHCGRWRFTSNSGLFEDLSDYFEAYLIGWFG